MIVVSQTCIEFTFPPDSSEQTKFDSYLTIKNVYNKPVGIRIKTTKREIYALTPTYLTINPNLSADIKIVYFRKDKTQEKDLGKHKFKIEAVEIADSSLSADDIKAYFDQLISSGKKVPGTIVKKHVYHKILDTNKENKEEVKDERKSNILESAVSQLNETRVKSKVVASTIEKSNIDGLKSQLTKNLLYLSNVKEEHRLKKQQAEMLKPSKDGVSGSYISSK